MDFREINFGLSDAHNEGEDYPLLLINGFEDLDQVVNRAINTSTFLFLGYKGSGKSSLSEHLRLTQKTDLIVDQQCLKEFPFKLFEKILDGEDRLIRYKSIWRWILCMKVLYNFIKTEKEIIEKDKKIEDAVNAFTVSGLFPVVDISSMVHKSTVTKASATLKILNLSKTIEKYQSDADIEMLTDYIKTLLLLISGRCSCRHIIVIDDLDDILAPKGNQFYNVAALISEVNSLNIFFSKSNVSVKIIILCRTDMFERLPDPNLNKIKQDKSFIFTWYREGIDTSRGSSLIKLINRRAKLVYPDIEDVIRVFFPARYEGKDIYSVLLDFTRHIPRDFVQLMKYIQNHCDSENVTKNAIEKGIKDYSSEYFKQEIENEMYGYLPTQAVRWVFNTLSTLRQQSFTFQQFLQQFSYYSRDIINSDVDVNNVMRILYDCSAIGHIYNYKGEGITRVTFKYRNRSSSFTPTNKIIIHKGLWKALNVNF